MIGADTTASGASAGAGAGAGADAGASAGGEPGLVRQASLRPPNQLTVTVVAARNLIAVNKDGTRWGKVDGWLV